jgi:hypothetical protein
MGGAQAHVGYPEVGPPTLTAEPWCRGQSRLEFPRLGAARLIRRSSETGVPERNPSGRSLTRPPLIRWGHGGDERGSLDHHPAH